MLFSAMNIADNVKAWYGDIKNWQMQGEGLSIHKTPACIDWQLIEQGELIKGKAVLNIGCFYPGDELAFSHLAKSWVSIDFSQEVIDRCKALNISTASFWCEDARNMEWFYNNEFNLVLDFSSGDQMPEEHYDEALKEIYRVLEIGGLFIVTYANYDYFKLKEVHGDFGYSRIYSTQELKDKIAPLGFELVKEVSGPIDRAGFIWRKV
jgi:SAM-dependent methyltransferase